MLTAQEMQKNADNQIRDSENFLRVVPQSVPQPQPFGSAVEHPKHYNSHPSGIECIDVVRHMGFNLGNVIKYIWRCDHKGATTEDLKKARFYLDDEIKLREHKQHKQLKVDNDIAAAIERRLQGQNHEDYPAGSVDDAGRL